MHEVDDLILISVDDHVIEPPDLFVAHLDAKYQDRAPTLVRNAEGSDVWIFGKVVMETAALNAVAGRPKEEYGMEPQSLDEVRPGCYDVHERVKDMDAGGVLASMNFPSFPTFTARVFASDDADLSLALVRAYNDWHIDEWCGAYPERFIPMAVPVIWDAEQTAAEIRRVAAKGCHSLSFTENPAALGYPSFHDEYWDPVWRACCDTGTVLSIHLGSSGRLSIPAVDSPPDVMITLQPMNIQSAAADLLWSRVLKNYPDLRVALSEGGTGWVPYFLERVDRTFEMHRAWTLQDFGGRLPSEVFREHFLTCFISDPVGIEMRDRIGIDNIAWEADYPHSDSMWPSAPEELATEFATYAVPESDIRKMTHENAMRWYSFDPFSRIAKEEATVGALRRRAAGHDVSVMSRSTRVRTADEKLEGYRSRARRAVAAAWTYPVRSFAPSGFRRSVPHLLRPSSQPVPQGGAGIEDVGLGEHPRRGGVTPVDGVEQDGVVGSAPADLLGEQLEVAGRYHPNGLAQVGQESRRAGGPIEGTVEAPVGGHHIAGMVHGQCQLVQGVSLGRAHSFGRPLCRLAAQRGQHGEVVDRVLGRDPEDGDAAARADGDESLVGELEERLAHRRAAGPELMGDLVEVEPRSGLQPAGEDPITQFAGGTGPYRTADRFEI